MCIPASPSAPGRGRLQIALVLLLWIAFTIPAGARLPPSFQDTVKWSGLTLPTAVRFAPDGHVFIAEKSGIIKVLDDINDPTPSVFADLTVDVHDWIDRGLNSIAIDPGFPVRPYVYAFFTVDAPPGGTPPVYNDFCAVEDDCLARSRLVRLTASGGVAVSQQILLDGDIWCERSVQHAAGDLAFGADGYLYVSHGDGGTSSHVDYGQTDDCAGNPPLEGGALKSQDRRTTGDPNSFDGTIIRIDPDTGAAAPGNPLTGGPVTDDDSIIADGLRNPFRFAIDALTGRLWIADVGWGLTEEIDLVQSALGPVMNFGWPCYEGNIRQPGYEAANLPICEAMYPTNPTQGPYYSYNHPGAQGAVSAIALYRGNNFPASYDGALFFADYTAGWIRYMPVAANGLPNTAAVTTFVPGGAAVVDLQVAPGGELFYVDIYAGTVHMVKYFTMDAAPAGQISTDVTAGALPLTVHFDGSASSDPEGQTLTYAWDLDGDGMFDDATGPLATFVYPVQSPVVARLRVTDPGGQTGIDSVVLAPGVLPPQVTIVSPTPTSRYRVGDVIAFSGSAIDPDTGQPIPVADLTWQVLLDHCAVAQPLACHEHFIRRYTGVAGGSLVAPDHEYPAFLRFVLTATKPIGSGLPPIAQSVSVDALPETTTLSFESNPSGLQLAIYGAVATTPFTRTVIVNATTTVSAPTPQTLQGLQLDFASWSDGGAQTHLITAAAAPATYTADFIAAPTITSQPAPRLVLPGDDTAFAVAAGGYPAPTYQWQVSTDGGGSWGDVTDTGPYNGATASTLQILGVPVSLDQALYRAIVTNSVGVATSDAAPLLFSGTTDGSVPPGAGQRGVPGGAGVPPTGAPSSGGTAAGTPQVRRRADSPRGVRPAARPSARAPVQAPPGRGAPRPRR